MKLYENVVIGNFLYALGFAIATKSKSQIGPSIVNLLQQTPADKALADVLLAFPGVVRLIEFKRRENKSTKEKAKHIALTEFIGKDNEDQIKLSKSIHWFVETTSTKQTFVSRIVPYLEAYPRKNCQHSLERFIEKTAEDAVHGEARFSDEEIHEYLERVAYCQVPDVPDKKRSPIPTGGILLRVDDRGNLIFGELTDMGQLRLLHREYVRERERELERSPARTIERSNSRDWGFER